MADIRTSSANALTFSFSTQTLRAVMINGEPWFVASDVADALAYRDAFNATRFLDDDEKGTQIVSTPSGEQEMTVINESGLYACILKSRKPEAKKFKKWVTSEVLPAIRKTGRYVAATAKPEPQPAPPTAREKLNATDMQHLKRIVWLASNCFHMDGSANQGIWYYLRQVTNNPAPNAYSVDHIPLLAPELRRIINISWQVRELTQQIEEQAVKRIFRKGDAAEKILKSLAAQAQLKVNQLEEGMAEFPTWMESELLNFTCRKPLGFSGHSYSAEQPDFFLNMA